eukprot:m.212072 g.212072  ORF g.212072 m.212072 type:complete len:427 (-) comp19033_c0_seq1:170-1450(-)
MASSTTKVWDLASGLESVRELQVIVNSDDVRVNSFGKSHNHPMILEIRKHAEVRDKYTCSICKKIVCLSATKILRCISSRCGHIECQQCHTQSARDAALRQKADNVIKRLLPVLRSCSSLAEEIKSQIGLNSSVFTGNDASTPCHRMQPQSPDSDGCEHGDKSGDDATDVLGHTKKRDNSSLSQDDNNIAQNSCTNTFGNAEPAGTAASATDGATSQRSGAPTRSAPVTNNAPAPKRRRRAPTTKDFYRMAEQVMQHHRMNKVLQPEDIYPTGDLAALQREAREDMAKFEALHKPNSQLQQPDSARDGHGKDRVPHHERGMYDNMPLSCDELFCNYFATTAPSLATHRAEAHRVSQSSERRRTGDAVDPYEVLGLPKYSTVQLIKARYHHLCRRWHPDRNSDQDTTTEFQLLQRAYNDIAETFANN